MFSSFVVIGSLGSGILFATGAGVVSVFAAAAVLMAAAGGVVLVLGDGPHRSDPTQPGRPREGLRLALPFVAGGLVGALGFAAENPHQSWSAIFLVDQLGAAPWLAAVAPATFAVFAALTRFAVGRAHAHP